MTAALLLAALVTAAADDRLAVLAVADPPGPGPELVELTHQLRAACRDRAAGVVEPTEMRARLLGRASSASLAELDRAYAGALASYQAGEYRSTIRTLRAVVDELERSAESAEAHAQWLRAMLRLAHAELTVGHRKEFTAALEAVAAIAPDHQPDADQFSPTFRRDFEAARDRVAARRRHRLSVVAPGATPATVYVNGKAIGTAPTAILLPPGRYRVGGASGALRVPSRWIDLRADARVALDLPLAAALRPDAGPGLAVAREQRADALRGAAGWLGATRIVAVTLSPAEGAAVLHGALHDGAGAVVREGHVRVPAGVAPGAPLSALAGFLLGAQPSPLVAEGPPVAPPRPAAAPSDGGAPIALRSPGGGAASGAPGGAAAAAGLAGAAPGSLAGGSAPGARAPLDPRPLPAPASRPGWMKPAAFVSAGLALGAAGLAVQQGLSARGSYGRASDLVRPDGAVSDPARYRALTGDGDRARRNAWIGAAGAAGFAAVAGVLGYLSWTDAGAPAVRF